MNCISKYKDRMECVNCGWEHKNPLVKRNCQHFLERVDETPKRVKPSFLQKVTNFAGAVVKDVATGMKRTSEEEINRRLSICKECPFYIKKDEESGSCSKCGCPISRDRVYLNKVYWESEHCPDNPPRW